MELQVVSQIQLVLDHHPALRLTPWQRQVFELSHDRTRGWQNQFAKERRVTRQNVTNTLRIVRRKIVMAGDLVKLWQGDLQLFFRQYSIGWGAAPTRKILWPLLRYNTESTPETQWLRRQFFALQAPLLEESLSLISQQCRRKGAQGNFDAHTLAVLYDMLTVSAYINPHWQRIHEVLEGLQRKFAAHSWLLSEFAHGTLPFVQPALAQDFRQWLEERIISADDNGARLANYFLGYYHAISSNEMERVIAHDGAYRPRVWGYDLLVRKLYNNMERPPYWHSSTWSDINFLRLILITRHFPLTHEGIKSNKNTLVILCQRALHSSDSFVVSHAEQMLHEMARP